MPEVTFLPLRIYILYNRSGPPLLTSRDIFREPDYRMSTQDQAGRAPEPESAEPGRRVSHGGGVGERLKEFIRDRGEGLRNMYGETGDESKRRLRVAIKSGEEMARKLVTEMGCTGEVAKDLAVLTLYDLAILIGAFWWYCAFPRVYFAHHPMDR